MTAQERRLPGWVVGLELKVTQGDKIQDGEIGQGAWAPRVEIIHGQMCVCSSHNAAKGVHAHWLHFNGWLQIYRGTMLADITMRGGDLRKPKPACFCFKHLQTH